MVACTCGAAVTISGIDGVLLDEVQKFGATSPVATRGSAVLRAAATGLPLASRPASRPTATTSRGSSRASRTFPGVLGASRPRSTRRSRNDRRVSGFARRPRRDDPPLRDLAAAFPLQPGGVLRHDAYRLFKGRLQALANERGYLEGTLHGRAHRRVRRASTADVTLDYDSGPRYAFGGVTFATDALTDRCCRVRRVRAGRTLRRRRRRAAAARARRRRVLRARERRAAARCGPRSADPDPRGAAPARPTSYSVGGGFSTDDGPRFSFSYRNVLRNREGHQLTAIYCSPTCARTLRSSTAYPSAIRSAIGSAIGPVSRAKTSTRASALLHVQACGVRVSATRSRARVSSTCCRARRHRRRGAVDAAVVTRVVVGAELPRRFRAAARRPSRESSGHARRRRHRAVQGRRPQRSGYGDAVGCAHHRPRPRRRDVRTMSLSQVPLSMRFFAGGDNSVRGYDYESLGPRNAAGELIGGNRLIEASIEYEHPVRKDWSVADLCGRGQRVP